MHRNRQLQACFLYRDWVYLVGKVLVSLPHVFIYHYITATNAHILQNPKMFENETSNSFPSIFPINSLGGPCRPWAPIRNVAPVEPAQYAPPLDPVGDLTGAIGI